MIPRVTFVLFVVATRLACGGLDDLNNLAAQDIPPAASPTVDKYVIDPNAFRANPREGVLEVERLLIEATLEQAPPATIAKLRYVQALTAHRCHDLINREQMVVDILRPVIDDPAPLLGDVQTAETFVSVVQLFCSPMYEKAAGPISQAEIVRRAIEDTNAAAALSERDRFFIATRLALHGGDLAQKNEDYAAALLWLVPYLEDSSQLAADLAGATLLCELVGHCGFYHTKLGQFDNRGAVYRTGMKTVVDSADLRAHEKLMLVSRLLSRYLSRLQDHADDPDAAQAWSDAQVYLANVQTYTGPEALKVHAAGLELSRYSVYFLGDRDLDKSLELVEQVTRQFAAEPELAAVEQAVPNAFYMSIHLVELMRTANDPRAKTALGRLEAFLDRLLPIVPDKRLIDELRAQLPKRIGS